MADKIVLNPVATFQNDTSAVATVNANSVTVVNAMDNTLSRDGTQPNQMGSNLDMNNNHILNLPTPVQQQEPLRVMDATSLNGAGTIVVQPLPTGGTVGQVLEKNSSVNFDASWQTLNIPIGVGQITSTNIATNTVTNANLNQMAADTLKGNPTSSASNAVDFTIPSLTIASAPDATNDYLIINDHTTGTLKRVNPTVLIGSTVAGVTSIAANTGAFTLGGGITNSTNQIKLSLTNATHQVDNLTSIAGFTGSSLQTGYGSTCTLTPTYSGRVFVQFSGDVFNATAGQRCNHQTCYGTGTAPVLGAALVGTTIGTLQSETSAITNAFCHFTSGGIVTGLTPGTPYWFDLQTGTTGGNGSLQNGQFTAFEF